LTWNVTVGACAAASLAQKVTRASAATKRLVVLIDFIKVQSFFTKLPAQSPSGWFFG
jgi:hypothetical protein